MQNRLFSFLGFILPSILSLLFFLCLFWCLSFAGDEYRFAALFKTHGFIGTMKILYFKESFRYSNFALNYFIFFPVKGIYSYPFTQLVVFALMFLFGVLEITKTIRHVFLNVFDFKIENKFAYSLAVLFLTQLFFMTSQASEVFASVCGLSCYVFPVMFLFVGFNNVTSLSKSFASYFMLILSALVIGGCVESLSIFIVLLCFCIGVLYYRILRLNKVLFGKLLLFTFVLGLGILVPCLSAGARSRFVSDPTMSSHSVPANLYNYFVFSFWTLLRGLFSARFFAGILMLLPLLFFSAEFLTKISDDKMNRMKRVVKYLSLINFACFIFNLLLVQLLYGNYGYMRMWFPFNISCSVFLFFVFVYLGIKFGANLRKYFYVSFLTLLFMGAYAAIHVPILYNYHQKYSERISYLKSTSFKKDEVVKVVELPDHDILSTSDINTDPDSFMNITFTIVHDLHCKVALDNRADH